MRYLLVKRGFRLVEAIVVLAALFFVLTGSRIEAIDRLGNRADIVAAVVVTALAIALLRAVNRLVMVAIDRRFSREAYSAQVVLTELGEAVRTFTKIAQLLELVAAKIRDALHPENVTIFLAHEATGDLVSEYSSGHAPVKDEAGTVSSTLVLPHDGWVIERLSNLSPSHTIEFQREDDFAEVPLSNSPKSLSADETLALRAIRPALMIPIRSNGHLYGVISLGHRLGDLPFSKEDEQLLTVVAGQMAISFENTSLIRRMAEEERIKRELEMAADVQRQLFPAGALEDETLELYGTCLPARWVGGDYYDYFVVREHRVGIAIGDVAGKGIAAALLMSNVQALLWCQLPSGDRRLTEIVSSLNRLLRRSTGEGGYATFFLAEFDEETRGLTYVNAGHNPPMLFHSRDDLRAEDVDGLQGQLAPRPYADATLNVGTAAVGTVRAVKEEALFSQLTTGGPIIGTFLDLPYEQETIYAESGDVLVAFTDGVTEAQSPEGIEFGEERLRSLVTQSLHLAARELAERIMSAVREWQADAPQHDDITLIVAKVK
jgi:sigma-B regulation protein RsbU (phosphoserine phosphatase)